MARLAAMGAAVVVAGLVGLRCGPLPAELLDAAETSTVVTDRHGVVLYERRSSLGTRSTVLAPDALPPVLVDATLAAATLHEPELLFLDEPTSAVDPENRRSFWETLFDLVAEGTTILVSDWKSTRLNSSHMSESRMPSSA